MDPLVVFIIASFCLHVCCNFVSVYHDTAMNGESWTLTTNWSIFQGQECGYRSYKIWSLDLGAVDQTIWPVYWLSSCERSWLQNFGALIVPTLTAIGKQANLFGWFIHVIAILVCRQCIKLLNIRWKTIHQCLSLQNRMVKSTVHAAAICDQLKEILQTAHRQQKCTSPVQNFTPKLVAPSWYSVDFVSGEYVGPAIVRTWHLRGMPRDEIKKRLMERYQAAINDKDFAFISKLRDEAEFLFGTVWINTRMPMPSTSA